MVPNIFINLDNIEDFKKNTLKTGNQLPAVVNCVFNYIVSLVSLTVYFNLVLLAFISGIIFNYFVN